MTIDDGIPLPTGRSKYHFHRLAVGQSFLVTDKNLNHMQRMCRHHNKVGVLQFKAANVDGGVRVWRIA